MPPPRNCARTSTELQAFTDGAASAPFSEVGREPLEIAPEKSEFELIGKYFSRLGAERGDVRIGVGDDGAVVMPPSSRELVLVTDTLVEGVHFPVNSSPASIGHRAFAVNLSDLAAMGAEPAWGLLALTIPRSRRSLAGAVRARRRRPVPAGTAFRSWAATPRVARLR